MTDRPTYSSLLSAHRSTLSDATPGDGLDHASFQATFAPLAHHLFPDGCPCSSLAACWPRRSDRSTVPASAAKSAIHDLRTRALMEGKRLSTLELSAVIHSACATLGRNGHEQQQQTNLKSPLVDGTTRWFCTIVKTCLFPDETATLSADALELLVCKVPADEKGPIAVLRFLTLLVRSGTARGVFDLWYDVLLQHTNNPKIAPDAVRLLHAITRKRHVRPYRAQKLQRWYNESRDKKEKQQIGALWVLLQLYGRLSKCGQFVPTQKMAMSVSRMFQSECFVRVTKERLATHFRFLYEPIRL